MTDDASEAARADAPGERLTPKNGDVTRMCSRALELGGKGYGRAEIAQSIGCSRAQLAKWAAEHSTLAAALAQARDLELAWWERKGREGVENGKLNATLWSKAMAGRFPDEGYGERAPTQNRREAPGRRRPLTHRDRAKAVRLLLAECGPPSAEPDTPDCKGEPR